MCPCPLLGQTGVCSRLGCKQARINTPCSSTCFCKSQDLFGELTTRVFPSLMNSGPFISLCIVYSNIEHRAHKSSPCSAKTASSICMHRFNRQHPLPINVSPSLSPFLSVPPKNTFTDPCIPPARKNNGLSFFLGLRESPKCIIYVKKKEEKIVLMGSAEKSPPPPPLL